MTKIWGPHIWNFIHCFCEKISNNFFIKNRNSIFVFLESIVFNLPCPICSVDSRRMFKKINYNNIKKKKDLKELYFYYHNYVNKKLKKKRVDISILNIYIKYNLNKCFVNFYKVFLQTYKKRLNIYSYTLSLERNIAKKNVIKWWNKNKNKI